MIACRNQSPEEYINTVAVKLCAINSMNGFQERGGHFKKQPTTNCSRASCRYREIFGLNI